MAADAQVRMHGPWTTICLYAMRHKISGNAVARGRAVVNKGYKNADAFSFQGKAGK